MLEAGLELSAYRVLQEALTNALKHNQGADAAVTIRYQPQQLELKVTSSGRVLEQDGHGGVGGAGRGLLGMQERVTFYGGTLDYGPQPDGGFRVHATFPLRAS